MYSVIDRVFIIILMSHNIFVGLSISEFETVEILCDVMFNCYICYTYDLSVFLFLLRVRLICSFIFFHQDFVLIYVFNQL